MSPAREHLFSEPLPPAVVLDVDFVVNVLHEGEELHAECLEFATRMYNADVIVVHTSLLRVEFWNGWRRAVAQRGLPPEVAISPPLLPDATAERRRLYRLGESYLKDFLRAFRRYEIRLGARLLDQALGLIASYNLRSLDACLAASALRAGVPDVVSLDGVFRRVDGIDLWNNDIPSRRAARPAGGRR